MAWSKLSDELINELVTHIEGGNYLSVAAAAVGISPRTFGSWKQIGAAISEVITDEIDIEDWPDDEHPEQLELHQWLCYKLYRRMEVAEAKAESFAVLTVRKHMPDQWTAAMTFLERRHPDRWRKRQTLENVEGGVGAADGIDENALIEDPEALELLHDALEQVTKGKEKGPSTRLGPSAQGELSPAPE